MVNERTIQLVKLCEVVIEKNYIKVDAVKTRTTIRHKGHGPYEGQGQCGCLDVVQIRTLSVIRTLSMNLSST